MPPDTHARTAPIPQNRIVPRTSKSSDLVFYPAYCHKASPTYFTWVKLTAYDVHHTLVARPEFANTLTRNDVTNDWRQHDSILLFYLNHPVQFVQLVGVIVTFEDYFEKFWLFTVDDSSGATIEVNCRKPVPIQLPDAHDKQPAKRTKSIQKGIDSEETTRVATVQNLDIGTVVQVKGRITTFRNVRQLQLERIAVVQTTNHEMQLIAARTVTYETTLSKPWTLSAATQQQLLKEAHGDVDEEDARARRRRKKIKDREERERRHAQKIEKEYEREERKRKAGAEQARVAGEAIKRLRSS